MELSQKEEKLIKRLRVILYGQVVIYQENGQPVRIVRIEESVKL